MFEQTIGLIDTKIFPAFKCDHRNVKLSQNCSNKKTINRKATLARPTRRAETSMTRFEIFEIWRQKCDFPIFFLHFTVKKLSINGLDIKNQDIDI